MIDTLDAIEAPVEDLEEDDPGGSGHGDGNEDDEPSLGATEEFSQIRSWKNAPDIFSVDGEIDLGSPGHYNPNDQTFCDWKFGARDEREMHEDDEPSLGSLEGKVDQTVWATGTDSDLELDEAEQVEGESDAQDAPEDEPWFPRTVGTNDRVAAEAMATRALRAIVKRRKVAAGS